MQAATRVQAYMRGTRTRVMYRTTLEATQRVQQAWKWRGNRVSRVAKPSAEAAHGVAEPAAVALGPGNELRQLLEPEQCSPQARGERVPPHRVALVALLLCPCSPGLCLRGACALPVPVWSAPFGGLPFPRRSPDICKSC